jgi:hypothetical protein
MWASDIRFSEEIWNQFKPSYVLIRETIMRMMESELNAFEILKTITDKDSLLKLLKDLYILKRHDWRVMMFIDLCGLEYKPLTNEPLTKESFSL